ncbi:hypothetical protein [Salinarchaeum chitinilyticum]
MLPHLATVLQTTDPVELFVEITTADVVALPLLVVGIGLLGVTVGFVGFLALGAVLDAIGDSIA